MDTAQLPEAKYRRLDLFPAEVSGRIGYKRVVVTDSHLIVVGEGSRGPQVDSVEVLYDFSGNNKTGWQAQIDSEDGEILEIKKADGCGCGSRLRGAKIYAGVPLRSI